MADLVLPRGELKVLKAEDKDYERGMLVKLLDNGGYKMAYWYDKPNKPYPVEIIVDGKSIKKDGKVVEMKHEVSVPHEAHRLPLGRVQQHGGLQRHLRGSLDCGDADVDALRVTADHKGNVLRDDEGEHKRHGIDDVGRHGE